MQEESQARLWPQWWRKSEDRPAAPRGQPPVVRLIEHFLARLVNGGNDLNGEFELGAGALLGLLAAPGALTAFLMFDKYSSLLNSPFFRGGARPDFMRQDYFATSAPDKYLFISLAMAITGIATVLKWDKILPDAQDYLNLAPLPVPPRLILVANAAAIAIGVVVLALDVNGASTLLFPLIVTAAAHTSAGASFTFAAVHAFCLILASVFTFCAVFALLGVLAAVLPREGFRAISSWVRGALLIAFLMLLPSGYAAPALLRELARDPHSAVSWLPSFWFLGFYQSMQHRGTPALDQLATRAIPGATAAFAMMLVCYALSYRRRFASVLEGGSARPGERWSAPLVAFLDLFARRATGFERASHRFAVRALLRNEPHRLCLFVALGLGWLLGFQSATSKPLGDTPESAQLKAPLIAAYLLILGLRVAFELPASVPSNWIFRCTLDARNQSALPVARRVILAWLALGVLIPTAAAWTWLWGWTAAFWETVFVWAISTCSIEILLEGYRKVPLTCPMPGFRDNFLVLCLLQFLGFEMFTRAGAGLEGWMLRAPVRFLLLPAGIGAGWYWNRRRLRDAREAGEVEEGVTFDSFRRPAVERLDLSGG
jgi:hypothetical protein